MRSAARVFLVAIVAFCCSTAATAQETVVVTFIALAQQEPIVWVSYVPLLPLGLLLFTGLYLFVLPHATRWRTARRTAGQS